jgi:DNA-binding response OmpR family regulator
VHDRPVRPRGRLRRKLRELGAAEELVTVRGVGYVLR